MTVAPSGYILEECGNDHRSHWAYNSLIYGLNQATPSAMFSPATPGRCAAVSANEKSGSSEFQRSSEHCSMNVVTYGVLELTYIWPTYSLFSGDPGFWVSCVRWLCE